MRANARRGKTPQVIGASRTGCSPRLELRRAVVAAKAACANVIAMRVETICASHSGWLNRTESSWAVPDVWDLREVFPVFRNAAQHGIHQTCGAHGSRVSGLFDRFVDRRRGVFYP